MRRSAFLLMLFCLLVGSASADVTQLWNKRITVPDSGNNILVTTQTGPQDSSYTLTRVNMLDNTTVFSVVRFNRNGSVIFNRTQSHASGRLTPIDMKVDDEGNVYVLADARPRKDNDVVLYKYSSTGTLLWTQTIADRWLDPSWNLVHADERAVGLGLTSNSEAYVLHAEDGDPDKGVFAVVTRFTPNGNVEWSRDFISQLPTSYFPPINLPKALAVNSTGEALLLVQTSRTETVSSVTTDFKDEITVAKYDAAGNLTMAQSFGLVFDGQQLVDIPINMALDASGNPFVIGVTQVPVGINGTMVDAQVILKFNGSAVEWFKATIQQDQFGRTGNYMPKTLAVTGAEVVVGGSLQPFGAPIQGYAERHTSSAMTYRFLGSRGSVNAIAISSNGTVFLNSQRIEAVGGGVLRYFADAMQLSAVGQPVWTRSERLTDHKLTNGISIMVNNSHDVWIGNTLVKQVDASTTQAIPSLTKLAKNPEIVSLSATPASIPGGSEFDLTVTLDKRAFAGGFPVQIAADHSSVNIPSDMVIPANALSAKFRITTDPVSAQRTVTLRAMPGGAPSTTITLTTPYLESLTLSTDSVLGGDTLVGTVKISAPAVGTGARVSLSSTSNNVLFPKDNVVTIPAGMTEADFTIRTRTVATDEAPFISATFSSTARAQLTIFATQVKSFVAPTSIFGGRLASVALELTKPAPSGGMKVNITSDHSSVPPVTVTVPQGESIYKFLMPTEAVDRDVNVSMRASTPTASISRNILVKQPIINKLRLGADPIPSEGRTSLKVVLNGPAPAGGLNIVLTSSNPAVASVTPNAIVPGGTTVAKATIKAGTVTSPTTVTITATVGSSTKTITLTVVPG